MGMFERLGEKVERFKQEAVAARDDSAYRCRDCENRFHSERETCPECGSSELERVSEATESDVEASARTETGPETETETETRTETETE